MKIRYKVATYVEKKQSNGDWYHEQVVIGEYFDLEKAKKRLKNSNDESARIYKEQEEYISDGIYDWSHTGEVYLDYYDVSEEIKKL